jgi:hypothetical protein
MISLVYKRNFVKLDPKQLKLIEQVKLESQIDLQIFPTIIQKHFTDHKNYSIVKGF